MNHVALWREWGNVATFMRMESELKEVSTVSWELFIGTRAWDQHPHTRGDTKDSLLMQIMGNWVAVIILNFKNLC
jgi:hypothetical protein